MQLTTSVHLQIQIAGQRCASCIRFGNVYDNGAVVQTPHGHDLPEREHGNLTHRGDEIAYRILHNEACMMMIRHL